MPHDEGLALVRLARLVAGAGYGTIVEVGAYCGRSTLYLAAGIAQAILDREARPEGRERAAPDCVILSVDHHHGSEENQEGWEHHDASLVDPRTGRLDTLPSWRAAVDDAAADDLVIGVVGDSSLVASHWPGTAGLVLVDGGHGEGPAWADYNAWAPKVADDGYLAIHDVFPDPADGGRPPYELYLRALGSGAFSEMQTLSKGSLRVLRRMGPGC